jgi:GT2 family glycosyltransferase
MEEYDLGYRILDLGYSIAYDSSVTIIHNESPLGRTPHAEKMQMLWVNKSKVAYRYLPLLYFVSTTLMWSLQFLKKTSFNWKLWLGGWRKVFAIPRQEKRHRISDRTLAYIKQVEGRMWF